MSDTLEYIDAYFNGELEDSERQVFEDRCSSDENFASEVAFYISARGAVRQNLLEDKLKQWNDDAPIHKIVSMKPSKKPAIVRFVPYLAAACLLLAVALVFLFTNKETPQDITGQYLKKNYTDLKQYMDADASKDSVQVGINEYNNRNFNRALTLFEWASKNDSTNYDAKKYAGLTYMQMKNYDKALQRFKELTGITSRYNAGDILQASTLLQRNAPGDEEAAKTLLRKVVQEKEEGNTVAQETLDKWGEK